jgi:hypothetical protein
MQKQVDQYVRKCLRCRRFQMSRYAMGGVLWPLPIPEKPCEDIWIGFVVWLPMCEGFDAIRVVVDTLSMMWYFIPCHTTIDAVGLARLLLRKVVHLHDLPVMIVSDCRPHFVLTFWGQICSPLGFDWRMSTTFHPQTDGKTEWMNTVMEQYLWVFGNHQQDDWVQGLPLAEYAANNGVSESTKCTPFLAV